MKREINTRCTHLHAPQELKSTIKNGPSGLIPAGSNSIGVWYEIHGRLNKRPESTRCTLGIALDVNSKILIISCVIGPTYQFFLDQLELFNPINNS